MKENKDYGGGVRKLSEENKEYSGGYEPIEDDKINSNTKTFVPYED